MTNAEKAIELMINYLESERIMVGTPEITRTVIKWEERLNPIDFVSLAAVALENPREIALSRDQIRRIRNFYFPS